jgi:hypothetical protein
MTIYRQGWFSFCLNFQTTQAKKSVVPIEKRQSTPSLKNTPILMNSNPVLAI